MTGLGRWYRALALLWLNTCLVFVVANLVAWAVLGARRTAAPEVATSPYKAPLKKAYPTWTEAEIEQLIRESAHPYVYEPFTQFREQPMAGKYVNVDARGFRVTKDQGPWPPPRDSVNVFLFGGSTTFSYGVPDGDTLASHLQDALAAELARPPRLYNFGRGAYYSSQEHVLFERLLVRGAVPDLAIFVDGLNDFMFPDDRPLLTAGLEDAFAREREGAATPLGLVRSLPLGRAFLRPPTVLPRPRSERDPSTVAAVIDRYVVNRRLSEAAAQAVGARAVFVWQPVPTYKYDLRDHVVPAEELRHQYARVGYPAMAEFVAAHPLGPNFVWCADIQEGDHELLYVDSVHYAPRLLDKLARCIADALRARALLP